MSEGEMGNQVVLPENSVLVTENFATDSGLY